MTIRGWQNGWKAEAPHPVKADAERPFVVVPKFPYPTCKVQVGHVRNYAISDVQARYWRRRGGSAK
ncbi:MAG: hypothetical protein ACM3XM_00750 [Mycobacterium leprae]